MRPRAAAARFIIRLGTFIQSLALMIMKPEDLMAFSHRSYSIPKSVKGWSAESLIESGLTAQESVFYEKINARSGKILVLGVGGGREAIFFCRMGFEVTGVDFVPDMVQAAVQAAEKRGLRMTGLVQNISRLEVPAAEYDIVWLSEAMYSCIPRRKVRREMLEKILSALKPGGFFVCQFYWNPRISVSPRGEIAKKLFAAFTLGNLAYERGDFLQRNVEFLHAFTTANEIRRELDCGGSEIVSLVFGEEGIRRGGAILKRI